MTRPGAITIHDSSAKEGPFSVDCKTGRPSEQRRRSNIEHVGDYGDSHLPGLYPVVLVLHTTRINLER